MTSKIKNGVIRIQQLITRLGAQEQGATLIFVALTLPVLLGFAALAIDGSNIYAQQRQIQTAADAAALAGAQILALGSSTAEVQGAVQDLIALNGADSYTLSYLNDNTEVQVTAVQTFATFFAGIVGYDTLRVQATAKAYFAGVASAGNLLPMIIECANPWFTYDVEYEIFDGDKDAPGNFGWVTWNGSPSANTLADNLTNPSNSGIWNIGDWVDGATGQMNSSAVRNALDNWIASRTAVTIPLYDAVAGNGSNTRYKICGFAEFVLTRRGDNSVHGKFQRGLTRGGSVSTAPDYGVRDVRISQ
jgi:Flp pilus assembly protein TadG